MSIEYRKQRVPFNKPVFNGLPLESKVELECIPYGECSEFYFEYTTAKNVAIQIEVSLRGDGIDLRSLIQGQTIREEWFPRSISLDKKICLSIIARSKHFEIAMNNQHLRDFDHQAPISKIERLSIRGDIGILSVKFSNFGENLEPPRPGCENFFRFSNSGLPIIPSPTPFAETTFNRSDNRK